MPYSRRDRIGHYVTKRQQTQRPCTHACCRGYREHPDKYPVILPDRTLRRARDEDLQRHFTRVSADPSPKGRRAEAQILHEMERRDAAEQRGQQRERARLEAAERRARSRESAAATRAAARMEREAETERIRLEAEAVTGGYMVNARGRLRNIMPEDILTGREVVFQRYASDEARDYFAVHPRPTARYFRGQRATMERLG